MNTDLHLTNGLDVLDGLAAMENFSRFSTLYIKQLTASGDALEAADRRLLLTLAQRSLDLVQPADLFLQLCQEQIQQAVGVPQFEEGLKNVFESEFFGAAAKSRLTGKDLVKTATASIQDTRARLASERERLPKEIGQLQGGQRPVREDVAKDVSADAVLGAGATFLGAGAALLAGAALAPKTAGASAVAGVAVAGAILSGAGIGSIIVALEQ
jgi:hypothetical protein